MCITWKLIIHTRCKLAFIGSFGRKTKANKERVKSMNRLHRTYGERSQCARFRSVKPVRRSSWLMETDYVWLRRLFIMSCEHDLSSFASQSVSIKSITVISHNIGLWKRYISTSILRLRMTTRICSRMLIGTASFFSSSLIYIMNEC